MPPFPADLSVNARWVAPMRARGEMLERHTVVVKEGRILDVLPAALAAERYAARAVVDRDQHLLLPGLIDAYTRLLPPHSPPLSPSAVHDGAELGIARLLRGGVTCFCDVGYFPQESARAAAEQGMRALIGLPVAEHASRWAANAADCLTRALRLRDEYRGHPLIGTAFAPLEAAGLSDATFARLAVLAAELDAGIVMTVHETRAEIAESLARHGLRPLQRLHALGLLTPALTAAHAVHLDAADLELARRGGIAAAFCPVAALTRGEGAAPAAAWADAGLRSGIGTGTLDPHGPQDLWMELKLLAAARRSPPSAAHGAWDALAAATCDGAAALGLDARIGTLEPGKDADLCCLDLRGPALQPLLSPVAQSVHAAGHVASDVWVAGRQLVERGAYTRLDWPALSARLNAQPAVSTGALA